MNLHSRGGGRHPLNFCARRLHPKFPTLILQYMRILILIEMITPLDTLRKESPRGIHYVPPDLLQAHMT